ncbi:MAG TPA: uroporphyrinogen-III synthase [Methanomicrobiales archaeon]|jgi:uroporphyrinogen-III synthase|nr:uroporphyrinogen-III synthase [Methanomicrobiales archaeon]
MRIAVTRVAGKGARDAVACRKHGHECYTVSPLRVEAYPDRLGSFVEAANRGELDCIFFASAVPAELLGPFLRSPPRVIAIGPQTARTLEKHGIRCETLPAFYSRDFVPYLGDWIRGKRIGIPRADVPNPALIRAIGEAGGIPVEVRVYGLIPTREPLATDGADAILFTSASSFSAAVWQHRPGLLLMAIGEITAGVMRAAGAEPAVVGDGSLEGTLVALDRFLVEGSGEDR